MVFVGVMGQEGGKVSESIQQCLEPIIISKGPADRLYCREDFPIEEDAIENHRVD